jgi:hypothetical protein
MADQVPCPCGTCKPRHMLGRSWWKLLGFNAPTDCAVELRNQGHYYVTDWCPEHLIGGGSW